VHRGQRVTPSSLPEEREKISVGRARQIRERNLTGGLRSYLYASLRTTSGHRGSLVLQFFPYAVIYLRDKTSVAILTSSRSKSICQIRQQSSGREILSPRESNRKGIQSMLLSRTKVLIWAVGFPVAARAFGVKSISRQFCRVASGQKILATDMLVVCDR
jgi:hypothetical protein